MNCKIHWTFLFTHVLFFGFYNIHVFSFPFNETDVKICNYTHISNSMPLICKMFHSVYTNDTTCKTTGQIRCCNIDEKYICNNNYTKIFPFRQLLSKSNNRQKRKIEINLYEINIPLNDKALNLFTPIVYLLYDKNKTAYLDDYLSIISRNTGNNNSDIKTTAENNETLLDNNNILDLLIMKNIAANNTKQFKLINNDFRQDSNTSLITEFMDFPSSIFENNSVKNFLLDDLQKDNLNVSNDIKSSNYSIRNTREYYYITTEEFNDHLHERQYSREPSDVQRQLQIDLDSERKVFQLSTFPSSNIQQTTLPHLVIESVDLTTVPHLVYDPPFFPTSITGISKPITSNSENQKSTTNFITHKPNSIDDIIEGINKKHKPHLISFESKIPSMKNSNSSVMAGNIKYYEIDTENAPVNTIKPVTPTNDYVIFPTIFPTHLQDTENSQDIKKNMTRKQISQTSIDSDESNSLKDNVTSDMSFKLLYKALISLIDNVDLDKSNTSSQLVLKKSNTNIKNKTEKSITRSTIFPTEIVKYGDIVVNRSHVKNDDISKEDLSVEDEMNVNSDLDNHINFENGLAVKLTNFQHETSTVNNLEIKFINQFINIDSEDTNTTSEVLEKNEDIKNILYQNGDIDILQNKLNYYNGLINSDSPENSDNVKESSNSEEGKYNDITSLNKNSYPESINKFFNIDGRQNNSIKKPLNSSNVKLNVFYSSNNFYDANSTSGLFSLKKYKPIKHFKNNKALKVLNNYIPNVKFSTENIKKSTSNSKKDTKIQNMKSSSAVNIATKNISVNKSVTLFYKNVSSTETYELNEMEEFENNSEDMRDFDDHINQYENDRLQPKPTALVKNYGEFDHNEEDMHDNEGRKISEAVLNVTKIVQNSNEFYSEEPLTFTNFKDKKEINDDLTDNINSDKIENILVNLQIEKPITNININTNSNIEENSGLVHSLVQKEDGGNGDNDMFRKKEDIMSYTDMTTMTGNLQKRVKDRVTENQMDYLNRQLKDSVKYDKNSFGIQKYSKTTTSVNNILNYVNNIPDFMEQLENRNDNARFETLENSDTVTDIHLKVTEAKRKVIDYDKKEENYVGEEMKCCCSCPEPEKKCSCCCNQIKYRSEGSEYIHDEMLANLLEINDNKYDSIAQDEPEGNSFLKSNNSKYSFMDEKKSEFESMENFDNDVLNRDSNFKRDIITKTINKKNEEKKIENKNVKGNNRQKREYEFFNYDQIKKRDNRCCCYCRKGENCCCVCDSTNEDENVSYITEKNSDLYTTIDYIGLQPVVEEKQIFELGDNIERENISSPNADEEVDPIELNSDRIEEFVENYIPENYNEKDFEYMDGEETKNIPIIYVPSLKNKRENSPLNRPSYVLKDNIIFKDIYNNYTYEMQLSMTMNIIFGEDIKINIIIKNGFLIEIIASEIFACNSTNYDKNPIIARKYFKACYFMTDEQNLRIEQLDSTVDKSYKRSLVQLKTVSNKGLGFQAILLLFIPKQKFKKRFLLKVKNFGLRQKIFELFLDIDEIMLKSINFTRHNIEYKKNNLINNNSNETNTLTNGTEIFNYKSLINQSRFEENESISLINEVNYTMKIYIFQLTNIEPIFTLQNILSEVIEKLKENYSNEINKLKIKENKDVVFNLKVFLVSLSHTNCSHFSNDDTVTQFKYQFGKYVFAKPINVTNNFTSYINRSFATYSVMAMMENSIENNTKNNFNIEIILLYPYEIMKKIGTKKFTVNQTMESGKAANFNNIFNWILTDGLKNDSIEPFIFQEFNVLENIIKNNISIDKGSYKPRTYNSTFYLNKNNNSEITDILKYIDQDILTGNLHIEPDMIGNEKILEL